MRLWPILLCYLGVSSLLQYANSKPVSPNASETPISPLISHHIRQSTSELRKVTQSEPQSQSSLTCRDITSVPKAQRCTHAREYCYTDEYDVGVLNYLYLYFCLLPKTITYFIAFLALLLNFGGLGKTAADFLSPNLYTISKALRLSDHLAGLTLLAVGNSAADIFGTYKAFSIGSTELAVSELIGATLFVLSVVIGSICIVHPFSVPKLHYARDGVCYLAILLLLELFMEKGSLSIAGSSILLGIYIVYVMVAVLFHSWSRISSRKKLTAARIRSNFEESNPAGSYDVAIDGSTQLLPGIDTLEDLTDEERKMLDELKSYFAAHPGEELEVPVPVQTGSYGLRVLLKELSHHSSGVSGYKFHDPSSSSFQSEANSIQSSEATSLPINRDNHLTVESIDRNLARSVSPFDNGLRMFKRSSLLKEAFYLLLPHWNSEDSVTYKVLFVLTYPAHILLSFTTPVREKAISHANAVVRGSNAFNLSVPSQESLHSIEEEYDILLDLLAFKFQFVFAILTLTLTSLGFQTLTILVFPLVVITTSAVSYVLLPSRCPQFESQLFVFKVWNYVGSSIGFILAIHWISVFAAEVIAILKQFALIFGISDEILGVTVFAMGNSIGDLVSNLTIALMGLPLMAFAACFGGPLLSLCSMGLSSILVMSKNETTHLVIVTSRTLRLNIVVIISILIFMNIYFSLNNYLADRRLGIILILIWIVTVTASAYFELH